MKRVAVAGLIAALCGCGAPAARVDTEAVSTAPLPAVRDAAPDAPPQILAVRLSSLIVRPGDTWTGRVVTTSNVASLEVRSPSFTFNAPRSAFGRFSFSIRVLVIPPIYRRPYTVAVVARNAAGLADERDVTVDFR
jgi:hypothetical protein